MTLQFSKMHGLGNDFMVIDGVRQNLPASGLPLPAERIRGLADRHFGIGFDQLLVVQPAASPEVDFRYRIFNADGSEVNQCGNGARCFARFVRDQGLTDKDSIRVETASGRMTLNLTNDGQVTVDMGAPRWAPKDIPLKASEEAETYFIVAGKQAFEVGAVGLGIRTACCWSRTLIPPRSKPSGRCWKATRTSRSGSMSASCRSSIAAISACGCSSAAPARRWPAAPVPVPRWWWVSDAASSMTQCRWSCPVARCRSVIAVRGAF